MRFRRGALNVPKAEMVDLPCASSAAREWTIADVLEGALVLWGCHRKSTEHTTIGAHAAD